MAEIDIADAIKRLRKHRQKFMIDTETAAYRSAVEMVDKLWPLRAAQLEQDEFRLRIYQPDANAADQEEEARKRRNSALLAKLAMPVWDSDLGIERTRPYVREEAIEAVAEEMDSLAKTGLYARERRVIELLEQEHDVRPYRAISQETLRYNASVSPKMREKLFATGLDTSAAVGKKSARSTPLRSAGNAPFVRGKKQWRMDQLLTACQSLQDVATWLRDNDQDAIIPIYEKRYAFSDLCDSKSKFYPADRPSRLAIAIGSADHCASGTDDYVANDTLSLSMGRIYGLYARAVAESARFRKRTISTIFNSLI